MMIAGCRALRLAAPLRASVRTMATKQSSVNGKGMLDLTYHALFKNNRIYVTSIIVAAIGIEVVYGKATNYVWETVNSGRLYHHIDWSRFKTEDDEDEEEEEEEEATEEEDEE